MKRWLIVTIPLLVLGGLMFVKPPAFTSTPYAPGTSSSTAKPGIPGGGGDEGGKPSYGGHEADEYGAPKKH
jgi:hypothetical protein